MRRDTGGKRVGKELFQAPTKAYKKYVVLFLALISSFFFVSIAFAKEPQAPNGQDSKTITVRAVVPLTPEFVFSIKKNSSLKLEKAAFALGEEVRVKVKIVGGNNLLLRGHKINLLIVNKQGETLVTISGETDNDGLTYFSFLADERLIGKNILRIIDTTYDEPIIILQEKIFIVYKPSDSKRGKELLEQKIIIHKSDVSGQETRGFFDDGYAWQNNDTINVDFKKGTKQKWGNDP